MLEAIEELKNRQVREDLNSTRSEVSNHDEPSVSYTAETCQTELASLAHDMVYMDQALQSSVFELIFKYLKCLRTTFRLAERPGGHSSNNQFSSNNYEEISRRRSGSVASGADHIQFILNQIARSVYMIWPDVETAYSSLDQNRCGLISLAQLRMGLEQNGVSAELLNDHGLIQHFQVRFPNRLIKLQEFSDLFPPPAGFYTSQHSQHRYGASSPGFPNHPYPNMPSIPRKSGHSRHFSHPSPDMSLYQRLYTERAPSQHSQREGSVSGFSAHSVPVERAGSISGFSTHSTPVQPYSDGLHRQAGAADTSRFLSKSSSKPTMYNSQDTHSVNSEPLQAMTQNASPFQKNDARPTSARASNPFGSTRKKMFTFDSESSKSKMNFNFSKLSQKNIQANMAAFGSINFNRSEQQTLKKKDPGSTSTLRMKNPLKTVIETMQQLRKPPTELFDFFKGNGHAVTVSSMVQGMKQCGVPMSEDDAKIVIAAGDKNKDKTMRLVEWEAFCQTNLPSTYISQFSAPRRPSKVLEMEDQTQHMLVEITKTIMSSEPSLSALFKKMCVGGGRRMTREDLIEALTEFGIQLGQMEADSLIKPFDKTGQGLSRAEFIRFVNAGKSLA